MIRRHRTPTIRLVRTTAAILLAAVVAAGCDGDDPKSGGAPEDDGPVKVREVSAPEPDEDLAEALDEDAAKALTDAGCTFGTYDVGEAAHVDEGDELGGEDFPPTGGDHYGDWAPFGLYDEPIDDGFVVHNLEHGGVAVWLGTKVDDATTDAVAGLLDDGEKWVVAPRRDIEGLFSAAWGVGLSCPPDALAALGPEPTADALDAWFDAVESTGSDAEKDVPPYAGAMKEPTPERDISEEAPF